MKIYAIFRPRRKLYHHPRISESEKTKTERERRADDVGEGEG